MKVRLNASLGQWRILAISVYKINIPKDQFINHLSYSKGKDIRVWCFKCRALCNLDELRYQCYLSKPDSLRKHVILKRKVKIVIRYILTNHFILLEYPFKSNKKMSRCYSRIFNDDRKCYSLDCNCIKLLFYKEIYIYIM